MKNHKLVDGLREALDKWQFSAFLTPQPCSTLHRYITWSELNEHLIACQHSQKPSHRENYSLEAEKSRESYMQQLIRYGFVGVVSNAAIYFVYLLITYISVGPKTAMTLVYIIGAVVGFIGNRKWTFAYHGDSTSAALRYVLAHLLGYLLNFLILFTFVDRLGYAHQWVQAAAIVIVAGFLFIAFKYFVFREIR